MIRIKFRITSTDDDKFERFEEVENDFDTRRNHPALDNLIMKVIAISKIVEVDDVFMTMYHGKI